MFGLKKKRGPTQPFTHADDCKIVKADPTTQIEWVEVETGHWQAVCQCGAEDYREPPTVGRDRLDPYDPSTFRHAGQCEHRDTTDPALLRAILKVRDGVDGGYRWVQCATCEHGWQVSHYPQPPMRLMPPPK
jgi:hypothetical protein